MSRKGESGAQLLARLQTRPDASTLDPWLFGLHDTSGDLPTPQVKVVELCGGEGVGKTELALHYTARTCLPSDWNGLSLPGLGAKVVYFCTDCKLNVLRLAIVLERLVQDHLSSTSTSGGNHSQSQSQELNHATQTHGITTQKLNNTTHNKQNTTKTDQNASSQNQSNSVQKQSNLVKHPNHPKQKQTNTEQDQNSIMRQNLGQSDIHSNSLLPDTPQTSRPTESPNSTQYTEIIPIKYDLGTNTNVSLECDTRTSMKETKLSCSKDEESLDSKPSLPPISTDHHNSNSLTPEVLNDIVQDSLGRVHIFRVSSSLQLLASLISLELTASCDPDLSLVVLDPISSFYWSDRALEPNNASCIETRMKHIAKSISKCVQDFGLTFLITKASLMGGSKYTKTDQGGQGNQGVNSERRSNEFLGRWWSVFGVRSIVLTRSCPCRDGTVKCVLKCADCRPRERVVCLGDGGCKFVEQ